MLFFFLELVFISVYASGLSRADSVLLIGQAFAHLTGASTLPQRTQSYLHIPYPSYGLRTMYSVSAQAALDLYLIELIYMFTTDYLIKGIR